MFRTLPAAALATLLAFAPPLAAQQGGADQLRAVQQSLQNAEQQLANARSTNPAAPPNFEQALRAVMAGQETLAGLRGGGGNNTAIGDAERELAGARRLLEGNNVNAALAADQLRMAARAVAAIGPGAATGPASNTAPSAGGGQPQR
jgi:type II secretory pathway pseudopilin PulG